MGHEVILPLVQAENLPPRPQTLPRDQLQNFPLEDQREANIRDPLELAVVAAVVTAGPFTAAAAKTVAAADVTAAAATDVPIAAVSTTAATPTVATPTAATPTAATPTANGRRSMRRDVE